MCLVGTSIICFVLSQGKYELQSHLDLQLTHRPGTSLPRLGLKNMLRSYKTYWLRPVIFMIHFLSIALTLVFTVFLAIFPFCTSSQGSRILVDCISLMISSLLQPNTSCKLFKTLMNIRNLCKVRWLHKIEITIWRLAIPLSVGKSIEHSLK